MNRQGFIDNLKENYSFVCRLSNNSEYAVYRFRHNTLGKDMVVRSYQQDIPAYYELVNLRCDNLPEIYDVISLSDGMIVLEEYIDGINVSQVMEAQKYSYREAKKVLRQVCKALDVLHSFDIVHRDIKPENIITDKNGRVVLIDFNASRKVTTATKDTVIMGTVGYASPEQMGLTQSDARTDVYAMGVLLNVMLTGRHPSEKIAKGRAGHIIKKCTSVDPNSRYQSAKRLSRAL